MQLGQPAMPPPHPPTKDATLFNKNGLQVKLKLHPLPADPAPPGSCTRSFRVTFMNITPVVFEDLAFLISIPKLLGLRMETLSSTTLPPLNTAPASQVFHLTAPAGVGGVRGFPMCSVPLLILPPACPLHPPPPFHQMECKFRFRITYALNGADVEEEGDYTFPS